MYSHLDSAPLTSTSDAAEMGGLFPLKQSAAHASQILHETSATYAPLWDRKLLDALSSTLDPGQKTSGVYRIHGENSWTWGDQNEWIKINLIRFSFGRNSAAVLKEYFHHERFVHQTSIFGLDDRYQFRQPAAVADLIAKHPQLIDFLLESHQELRKFFGDASSFVLEVVRDPELFPPIDFLFVRIRTSMTVDEAFDRLNQFDEAWYLNRVDCFGEMVNFNLEFE